MATGELCIFELVVAHSVAMVGVKFPIFAVNCCCLPLSFRRRGKMRKKRGKMRKKRGNSLRDPKVLLQRPKTSKFPKVVRSGCQRSFWPSAPKASCTGAKESCTGAKQGLGGAKDSRETVAPGAQNTFCTLS